MGLLLVTGQSDAKPPRRWVEEPNNFWRNVIDPNADRVRMVLANARAALLQPDSIVVTAESNWAADQSTRFYQDAFNLLRYARTLAPVNVEVLGLFARAADELGKTREALEALNACVRILGPEKAGPEITGRLGAIYLRMGDRDAAIRWLREAQGPIATSSTWLVHLANALAARGAVTEAIDTLHNALGSALYGPDTSLVAFSLAVIYDRDEQRAAAFEVLDHMKTTLQEQYMQQVWNDLHKLRFAPAEDANYYEALLYESLGHYAEARAQWALYAASGDTPWRLRALDHIALIDAERKATAAKPAIRPTRPLLVPKPSVP